jgi:hypothetical protein
MILCLLGECGAHQSSHERDFPVCSQLVGMCVHLLMATLTPCLTAQRTNSSIGHLRKAEVGK